MFLNGIFHLTNHFQENLLKKILRLLTKLSGRIKWIHVNLIWNFTFLSFLQCTIEEKSINGLLVIIGNYNYTILLMLRSPSMSAISRIFGKFNWIVGSYFPTIQIERNKDSVKTISLPDVKWNMYIPWLRFVSSPTTQQD